MGNHAKYPLDHIAAPVMAMLIERGLVAEWPFEVTKRGRSVLAQAPSKNVYSRALRGDDSGFEYLQAVLPASSA